MATIDLATAEFDTQIAKPPARRFTKWNHIGAVALVLVLVGIVSFFVITPIASDPNTLSGVRASLDEQSATVTGLAGTATAIGAGLSLVPGDALTPVSEKLMEVSGWFVVILVAIFVQKILVTVAGSIAFSVIVPLACGLAIISIYSGRVAFRSLALRLAMFAVVLALAVPASIWASTALTATHASAATAANAAEDEADNAPRVDDDAETESSGGEGFVGSIQSWLDDAIDNVGHFVESAANSVNEAMDDAVRASEYYSEQFALLLVTTCIMPILVLLLLWWVIKMLFSIDIGTPRAARVLQLQTVGAVRAVTHQNTSQTTSPPLER